jgi:hypothetical protein
MDLTPSVARISPEIAFAIFFLNATCTRRQVGFREEHGGQGYVGDRDRGIRGAPHSKRGDLDVGSTDIMTEVAGGVRFGVVFVFVCVCVCVCE